MAKFDIEAAAAEIDKGGALPVDLAGAARAFKGMTDGHVSEADVRELGATYSEYTAVTAGSVIGIPPQVSGPIGRFVGDKVVGGIVKGFKKIFGGRRRARRRRAQRERVAAAMQNLSGARAALSVAELGLQRTSLAYDLAEAAIAAGLFGGNKSLALRDALHTFDRMGVTQNWLLEENDWTTDGKVDGDKIAADPDVDQILAEGVERLNDAAEGVAAAFTMRAVKAAAEKRLNEEKDKKMPSRISVRRKRPTLKRALPDPASIGAQLSADKGALELWKSAVYEQEKLGKTRREAVDFLKPQVWQHSGTDGNFARAVRAWWAAQSEPKKEQMTRAHEERDTSLEGAARRFEARTGKKPAILEALKRRRSKQVEAAQSKMRMAQPASGPSLSGIIVSEGVVKYGRFAPIK